MSTEVIRQLLCDFGLSNDQIAQLAMVPSETVDSLVGRFSKETDCSCSKL